MVSTIAIGEQQKEHGIAHSTLLDITVQNIEKEQEQEQQQKQVEPMEEDETDAEEEIQLSRERKEKERKTKLLEFLKQMCAEDVSSNFSTREHSM